MWTKNEAPKLTLAPRCFASRSVSLYSFRTLTALIALASILADLPSFPTPQTTGSLPLPRVSLSGAIDRAIFLGGSIQQIIGRADQPEGGERSSDRDTTDERGEEGRRERTRFAFHYRREQVESGVTRGTRASKWATNASSREKPLPVSFSSSSCQSAVWVSLSLVRGRRRAI